MLADQECSLPIMGLCHPSKLYASRERQLQNAQREESRCAPLVNNDRKNWPSTQS